MTVLAAERRLGWNGRAQTYSVALLTDAPVEERQQLGRGRGRADRAAARRRRARLRGRRDALLPVDARRRARLRALALGRRRGRAGGLACRPERPRPLRGPLVAPDVGAADRRQHRADARRARGARRSGVVASVRGRRAGGRAGALPRRRRPLPRPLVVVPDRLAHRSRSRSCSPRRRSTSSRARSTSCRSCSGR